MEYRMLRNMAEAALVRGRSDVSDALHRAMIARHGWTVMQALLGRLDRIGVRGATRLLKWLEAGSILN
jgi:hypothetical protein